jgi:hypothetical protein
MSCGARTFAHRLNPRKQKTPPMRTGDSARSAPERRLVAMWGLPVGVSDTFRVWGGFAVSADEIEVCCPDNFLTQKPSPENPLTARLRRAKRHFGCGVLPVGYGNHTRTPVVNTTQNPRHNLTHLMNATANACKGLMLPICALSGEEQSQLVQAHAMRLACAALYTSVYKRRRAGPDSVYSCIQTALYTGPCRHFITRFWATRRYMCAQAGISLLFPT